MAEMDKQEPIAIIGAACRLPGGVSSLGSLWDMISHVKTGHGKIPTERWDADIWHHPDLDRKGSVSDNSSGRLTWKIDAALADKEAARSVQKVATFSSKMLVTLTPPFSQPRPKRRLRWTL